ncbi:MAG TPA: hypothetical protein VLG36_00470 [Candidatus Chromulinivoraceae bacterium]|nr:hypothetical protein [Candidatus Chromulinivoraceae bacterium]
MQTTVKNSLQNHRINKQARDQLLGLTAMFLLGMGVNLIGLPSEVTGGQQTATSILLSLHVLIGLSLVAGSIVTVVRAKSSDFMKLAWIGLATILITLLCGIMTAATESNWWSYGMSIGFIANFWIYGALFVKTRSGKE